LRPLARNQPVYFVRDQWVRERYEHEHPGWNNGSTRATTNTDESRATAATAKATV
jgi:hypothetical protein